MIIDTISTICSTLLLIALIILVVHTVMNIARGKITVIKIDDDGVHLSTEDKEEQ